MACLPVWLFAPPIPFFLVFPFSTVLAVSDFPHLVYCVCYVTSRYVCDIFYYTDEVSIVYLGGDF